MSARSFHSYSLRELLPGGIHLVSMLLLTLMFGAYRWTVHGFPPTAQEPVVVQVDEKDLMLAEKDVPVVAKKASVDSSNINSDLLGDIMRRPDKNGGSSSGETGKQKDGIELDDAELTNIEKSLGLR